MLTEQFIASVGVSSRPAATNVAKDAGIFIHEFQPLKTQRTAFKKSATSRNCLAVGFSHIFAAQAEKAVVHVYSREKGNQEATVPFKEVITCVVLTCEETVLVLGTAEGRLYLWEVASGRQISTIPAHQQAVTQVVVDPTGNFLLSASSDATVHVWSLPSLLSFLNSGVQPLTSIRTFDFHRAEIVALALGHSSDLCNYAVSASKDRTCFIWDYRTSTVLRTYLLSAPPTCLELDAADRAIYVGYETGSVQRLNLYTTQGSPTKGVHGTEVPSNPIQPSESSEIRPADNDVGAVQSLALSHDGCTLLSGHESGVILVWDVARGGQGINLLQLPLPGPLTNLSFLPVSGFPHKEQPKLKLPTIIKPKFGAFDGSADGVPGSYVINVELASHLPTSKHSHFEQALSAPSVPVTVLEEGLSELLAWRQGPSTARSGAHEVAEDYLALDDQPKQIRQLSTEEQNAALKAELYALRRVQGASFDKIDRLNAERKALLEREQKRLDKEHRTSGDLQVNGTSRGDVTMDYTSSSEG